MKDTNHGSFGSRLGFILVTAGCAVGLGNVWRFPYVVGQSGGALFVLIYLVFLLALGVPVVTIELAIGRAARKTAARAFSTLVPGKKWSVISWLCLLGLYGLMSFYCVVTGWLMFYAGRVVQGEVLSQSTNQISAFFGKLLSSPKDQIACSVAVLFVVCLICYRGVKEGVERFVKPAMTGMLILMVVLAGYSMSLDNASGGIEFFLKPDLEKAEQAGYLNVISNAMTQVFFTLSTGIGAILIFGSYTSRKHSLLKESLIITLIDTIVALLAGFIIFPACFNFGVNAGEGPGLIFITMPHVFAQMPGGMIVGSCFFIFLFIAAMTTVIAVVEALVAGCMELFGWSRHVSAMFNFVFVTALSVPVALGYNVWSGVHPLGGESTILDGLDFLVSKNLLPIGSLAMIAFCVLKSGWGWERFIGEVNTGTGIKLSQGKVVKNYFRFVLPAMILFIFIMGYYGMFA